MARITFDGVTKTYPGALPALDHLALEVGDGEFFSFVGPSGCGKTTALRVLAGLEAPTGGRIRFDGRDVTRRPTRLRGLGLVTEENRLIGHLTAERNIRFPLEVRGVAARGGLRAIDERVEAEVHEFGLTDLLERLPKQLSEGQRRLVQLARAVVGAPAILLLDEPLSNLDDQVREHLRNEIVRVQRARGLTTLMSTATQSDAMAMSDRIGVLFDGVMHQVGTPDEIYARPATASVGRFFGEPAMNVLPARVRVEPGRRRVRVLGHTLSVPVPGLDPYHDDEVLVGFRPDDVVLGHRADDGVEVVVESTESLGHVAWLRGVTREGTSINCVVAGRPPPLGTTLDVGIRPDRLHVFDPISEDAIAHPVG